MKKKKYSVKIFVISDDALREKCSPENVLERDMALNAVRAKCFSAKNLEGVTADDNGEDWELNKALLSTMIETCDAVAVVGDSITPSMEKQIAVAKGLRKVICVEESLRKKAEAMHLIFPQLQLAEICKQILA